MMLFLVMALQAIQPLEAPIIVEGQRDALSRYQNRIARNCPPAEEIDAAVMQFDAGDYEDAKHLLARTVARNRRHVAQHPRRMASLHATLSDVAEHEGDDAHHRRSALEARRILERHVGIDETATLLAAMNAGDALMSQGLPFAAEQQYRMAQGRAAGAGENRLAAMIAFRRAWLANVQQGHGRAERLVAEARELAPQDQLIQNLSSLLLTQVAVVRGDVAAVDRLVAQLRVSADDTPTLVHAPPYLGIEPVRQAPPGLQDGESIFAASDNRYSSLQSIAGRRVDLRGE